MNLPAACLGRWSATRCLRHLRHHQACHAWPFDGAVDARMTMEPSDAAVCDQPWSEQQKHFMRLALQQGRLALQHREVPVGCVIVRDGEVVGRGFNLTNETRNATRHAEFQAIDELLQAAGGSQAAAGFERCQLYVTCEPCIMCAGALALVRIPEVYFGCYNDKFGGCGSVVPVHEQGCGSCCGSHSQQPLLGQPFKVRGGLFAEEAITLLQEFYVAGNPAAPAPHRPLKQLNIPDVGV